MNHTLVDLYLDNNRFFGYKDFYNYYDFDVNNILIFKKSYNKYIIRYNDVNKMTVVPLKLKIDNFYGELEHKNHLENYERNNWEI